MSGESALRQYLRLVQIQWKQIKDMLDDLMLLPGEDKGLQPPEKKSDALHALFIQAVSEVTEAGMLEEALPRLEELQTIHTELVEEACYFRSRRASARFSWQDANTAWQEVDRLVLFVEARLAARRAIVSQVENSENPTGKPITFDEANRVVTINGIPQPAIDNVKAFRLFKLVADAGGEAVSRKMIEETIAGLQGKNTISNLRKKLPKTLQDCLKTNIGREGGCRYHHPKK